jgi:hypothetical protein
VSIERRAVREYPQCFSEAFDSGADEFARGRSQDGPGSDDGVDRAGFALAAYGVFDLLLLLDLVDEAAVEEEHRNAGVTAAR